MTMEEKVCNARISGTRISMGDHCVLTFDLIIEWGCCGYGYLGADAFTAKSTALVAMMRIMDTVGVEKWEDLPGKLIRIVDPGLSGRLTKIGNILEDKWFDIDEFFKSEG